MLSDMIPRTPEETNLRDSVERAAARVGCPVKVTEEIRINLHVLSGVIVDATNGTRVGEKTVEESFPYLPPHALRREIVQVFEDDAYVTSLVTLAKRWPGLFWNLRIQNEDPFATLTRWGLNPSTAHDTALGRVMLWKTAQESPSKKLKIIDTGILPGPRGAVRYTQKCLEINDKRPGHCYCGKPIWDETTQTQVHDNDSKE